LSQLISKLINGRRLYDIRPGEVYLPSLSKFGYFIYRHKKALHEAKTCRAIYVE
tara:strand:- start:11578 stop:11739 length:162 start_codon:yes stop_codon:yes gene_type:complete